MRPPQGAAACVGPKQVPACKRASVMSLVQALCDTSQGDEP